jgi:D-alanine-D-alanine ligase
VSTNNFGKVAVLLGGRSAEREISLQSGYAVLEALKRRGIDAHPFDPAKQPVEDLLRQEFSIAYIALHGRYGEDGTVQGALELMGLPYTGSGVLASALAIDKWRTKLIWQSIGVNTPRYTMLNAESDFDMVVKELGLPLIVKPSREGSTIGLCKVTSAEDLPDVYQAVVKHDPMVLAEQFIEGMELTAAIQAKYLSHDTGYFCPSGLSAELENTIQIQALQAHRILGCEGWGRVDLILDNSDKPYFLETNTSPGMTGHSLVPIAAKTAGIPFDDLVIKILELAHVG